jgi:hypothetical protein
MSTKAIVAWIVVVIVVVFAAWFLWNLSQGQSPAPTTQPSATQTSSGQVSGTQTAQPVVAASGASNANLNSDLNTIDSQTNAANSDSASVDQSFNDQPVQQSQL